MEASDGNRDRCGATSAALISALFIWVQVREMQRQTALQQEVREAAEQPYVWVDVGIQQPNGWNLELIIGNSGPTVATNIRVVVDPPFKPSPADEPDTSAIVEHGAGGFGSLAPGRRLFGRSAHPTSSSTGLGL